MQVQVDSSVWHRKAIGGQETACGKTIHYATIVGLRSESYLGELCDDGCFSSHELRLAARARKLEHDLADGHDGHHRQEFETGRFIAIRPDKPKK